MIGIINLGEVERVEDPYGVCLYASYGLIVLNVSVVNGSPLCWRGVGGEASFAAAFMLLVLKEADTFLSESAGFWATNFPVLHHAFDFQNIHLCYRIVTFDFSNQYVIIFPFTFFGYNFSNFSIFYSI